MNRTIKCRREYITSPVPGFATPERVRVLQRAKGLPGYFVVRLLERATTFGDGRICMHEMHIGAEVQP